MTRFRQYEQTAGQWTAQNPVLLKGEVGWESGATPKAKKGDGVTAWNSLPYAIVPVPDTSAFAPIASPTFTGDPKAPTPATADNDTSIATTAFVKAQGYATTAAVGAKADIASPTFTGDPKAPTPATSDNDTSIATTAFVKAQAYAPLASPTFTGNPLAPTPSPGDNDTSVATTAFVQAALTALLLSMHPVGSIKMTTVNTNPGGYIGGTWVAWGTGRVPVGVDTGQTEFDTVEETGGEKTHTQTIAEMPAHTHIVAKTYTSDTGSGDVGLLRANVDPADVSANSGGTTTSQGSGTPFNVLQPYITCYMWKRTA